VLDEVELDHEVVEDDDEVDHEAHLLFFPVGRREPLMIQLLLEDEIDEIDEIDHEILILQI